MWYARAGAAKFYALQLLQLLLSEERAARILTESASEGQVMVLIEDLNKHRILAEAQETGGASLFAPLRAIPCRPACFGGTDSFLKGL